MEWLKANTEGHEHGEVLFLEWWAYDDISGWVTEEPREALKALDEAIRLGYDDDPRAFYLRAKANFALCNCGLALQDIDTAISKVPPSVKDTVEHLGWKSEETLSAIRKIVGNEFWNSKLAKLRDYLYDMRKRQ